MLTTKDRRALFIKTEFMKLGISASTQNYMFSTSTKVSHIFRRRLVLICPPTQAINGTNAYAIVSSPRASGNEAMVISASWLSRTGDGDGTLNLRGVSTVLALADFLRSPEFSNIEEHGLI